MAFKWIEHIELSDEEFDNGSDDGGTTYSPPSSLFSERKMTSSDINSSKIRRIQRAALTNFVQQVRPDFSSGKILRTNSYNQLQPQSKHNFLASTRFLVNILLEYLAGDDTSQVRMKVFENTESNSFLSNSNTNGGLSMGGSFRDKTSNEKF